MRRYHPENYVRDYLISKNDPELNKTDWPLLDFPLVIRDRCRRDFIQIEQRLARKRKMYAKKREELNKKWKEVEKEGEALRENFIHFNDFLIVNKEKRKRASENIRDSQKFKEKTEKAIAELRENLNNLKETKRELDEKIREHWPYQEYLGKVIENFRHEEGVKNEADLVERFEYYVQLNQHLADESENLFVKLQNAKSNLDKFIDTGDDILRRMHSQSASLQNRYEAAVRNVRNWEYWLCQIRDNIHKKANEVNIVKAGAWNLYRMIVNRTGVNLKLEREDTELQFLAINTVLKRIRMVTSDLAPKKIAGKRKFTLK